jgi:hypothetical protein
MRRLTGLMAIPLIAGLVLPGCGSSSAPAGVDAPRPAILKKNDDIMRNAARSIPKKGARRS